MHVYFEIFLLKHIHISYYHLYFYFYNILKSKMEYIIHYQFTIKIQISINYVYVFLIIKIFSNFIFLFLKKFLNFVLLTLVIKQKILKQVYQLIINKILIFFLHYLYLKNIFSNIYIIIYEAKSNQYQFNYFYKNKIKFILHLFFS